ncbi:MAG: DUF1501 domain-containing protein [Phycisphaeraceae bacterium]|nr:DUF1501 domain-containing protein [Phycisphaeraceae bacterium]
MSQKPSAQRGVDRIAASVGASWCPDRGEAMLDRRTVLRAGVAAGAGLLVPGALRALEPESPRVVNPRAAESMIVIWLPGGMAQTDMWDPKRHTPFRKGMKGSELLGTCPLIPTAADGVQLGAGLENIASVMDKGCIVRSLANDVMFGAIHLKAQYYMMTGYLFPAGVKAPSMGAIVGRTRGRRHEHIPAYIYIGRDIDSSDEERIFINEFIGPGFYGVQHAPFMIPDATQGLATLSAAAGVSTERLDRRMALFRNLNALADRSLRDAQKAAEYAKVMDDARAMMDSPVKQAFDYQRDEPADLVAQYEPEISSGDIADKSYYFGRRFGHGLLLARRLVERGARMIQVEYQYGPFKGFDMHENGWSRMVEMKQQIDRPIARLIRDLDERGLLDSTLVVLATEFGRTLAAQPAAGIEPDGAAETQSGEGLTIEHEGMYGFHGHFSSCSSMVCFGGPLRHGMAYGKTADRHPMVAVENPVKLIDMHATLYHAMGIAPDTSYITEGRPFYVTKDGHGKPVKALLA